jgi:hypothetical protein
VSPAQSKEQPALEEEIATLEVELARVIALTATSDASRVDLLLRLHRLKAKAKTS